jgi:diguanylate cyclase (GGDEF)-like protein
MLKDNLYALLSGPAPRTRAEALRAARQTVLELLQAEAAAVAVVQRRRLRRAALLKGGKGLHELNAEHGPGDLVRHVTGEGRPYAVRDSSLDARFSPELDGCPGVVSGPALFAPLRVRTQGMGYLAAYREAGQRPFGSADAQVLMVLGSWLSLALENVRLAGALEKLAMTDELTKVFNYRFLKNALRREVKRAARFRQVISVIMLDVDNLKHYNDRHGHLRGSYLLREMAQLLLEQVRSWDVVAKYGGDEFTLILPQTDRGGAAVVAERLRAAVEAHAFPLARQGEITISLGVAVFPEDAAGAGGLLVAADRMLYAAKEQGRNTVVSGRNESPSRRRAEGVR